MLAAERAFGALALAGREPKGEAENESDYPSEAP